MELQRVDRGNVFSENESDEEAFPDLRALLKERNLEAIRINEEAQKQPNPCSRYCVKNHDAECNACCRQWCRKPCSRLSLLAGPLTGLLYVALSSMIAVLSLWHPSTAQYYVMCTLVTAAILFCWTSVIVVGCCSIRCNCGARPEETASDIGHLSFICHILTSAGPVYQFAFQPFQNDFDIPVSTNPERQDDTIWVFRTLWGFLPLLAQGLSTLTIVVMGGSPYRGIKQTWLLSLLCAGIFSPLLGGFLGVAANNSYFFANVVRDADPTSLALYPDAVAWQLNNVTLLLASNHTSSFVPVISDAYNDSIAFWVYQDAYSHMFQSLLSTRERLFARHCETTTKRILPQLRDAIAEANATYAYQTVFQTEALHLVPTSTRWTMQNLQLWLWVAATSFAMACFGSCVHSCCEVNIAVVNSTRERQEAVYREKAAIFRRLDRQDAQRFADRGFGELNFAGEIVHDELGVFIRQSRIVIQPGVPELGRGSTNAVRKATWNVGYEAFQEVVVRAPRWLPSGGNFGASTLSQVQAFDLKVMRAECVILARLRANAENMEEYRPYFVQYLGFLAERPNIPTGIVLELLKPIQCDKNVRAAANEHVVRGREAFVALSHLAKALEYLFIQTVIHRDVKPANILYDSVQKSYKLADFGESQHRFEGRTVTRVIRGTPYYMAPELKEEEGAHSPVDIFSFGVAAIHILTSTEPTVGHVGQHTNPPPEKIRRAADLARLDCIENVNPPRDLADFIIRCLDNDPEARPTAAVCAEYFSNAIEYIDVNDDAA